MELEEDLCGIELTLIKNKLTMWKDFRDNRLQEEINCTFDYRMASEVGYTFTYSTIIK